jgi:hypothetical protein
MHQKDIKRIIRKQLKRNYPNRKQLSKKEKKAIAKAVLEEAIADYEFYQEVEAPIEELIEIQAQVQTEGIMNLKQMERFIEDYSNSNIIISNNYNRSEVFKGCCKDQDYA